MGNRVPGLIKQVEFAEIHRGVESVRTESENQLGTVHDFKILKIVKK
jgi:hypothetical protein